MTTLVRTQSGLLLRDDFTSLAAWQSDGVWASAADPALIAFDPYPLLPPGSVGTGDQVGIRQPQLYIEGAIWYLIYDSNPGAPASVPTTGQTMCIATSTDQGVTWTRLGNMAITGQVGGYGGATSYSVSALGWLEKRAGTYYLHRVTGQAYYGPYGYDIWSSPSLGVSATPWTWRAAPPIKTQLWQQDQRLPGSVYFDGTQYHTFEEGATSAAGDTTDTVGHAAGTSPSGPFTVDAAPLMTAATNQGRAPENPKVFYHPGLGRYVMLTNLITPDGASLLQNASWLSTSVTDWSAASKRVVQHVSPLDSSHVMGVLAHATGPDGSLVMDASGNVLATFDYLPASAPFYSIQVGQSAYSVVLEPSASCARYTHTSDQTARALTRPLMHTDVVVECALEMRGLHGAGGDVTLEVRRQSLASSADCYRLVAQGNGTLLLQKRMGGVTTTVQTAQLSMEQLTTNGVVHRIRLVMTGSSITAFLNGEQQIVTTDTTFSAGVSVTVVGRGVDADVRLLSVRSGQVVTIKGTHVGQQVTARAVAGAPVTQQTAAGSSVALTVPHAPVSSIQIGTGAAAPVGGVWGGDTFVVIVPSSRRQMTGRGRGRR